MSAIDLVEKKGTVILLGLCGMDKKISLALDKIIYKEGGFRVASATIFGLLFQPLNWPNLENILWKRW